MAVSFRAILNQILENLALTYMDGEPFFTRDFNFQAKLAFYRANQLNNPLFDIYSSICGYYWKAKENALVRAIAYFDEVLGWTIGDLNYTSYLQKRAAVA